MDVNQINSYNVTASKSTAKSSSSSAASLSVDQFLSLLAAQLSNQDVLNPTQDTEFVAQMAQFTSLQALENLNQYSSYQYGNSLIGKKVSVARFDETGKYIEDIGVVSRSNFSYGETSIIVNGRSYGIANIMEIVSDSGSSSFQYAASLVGKAVEVSGYDKDGNAVQTSGIVSSCTFSSGEAYIVVDGQNYSLSAVRKVLSEVPETTDPEVPDETEVPTDPVTEDNG